ncbi:hypothetical protein [Saccharopolyspora indica]|uniref:hypothetical protein n=1 Tax=Saccharopolyspora indica TaxID=1229659 RepID=UPI0040266962
MTEAQPQPVVHPTTRSCPFDPHDGLRELREERPLAPMRCDGGRRGWLVTSHALVREVLADPRFGSRFDLVKFPIIAGDPEQQTPAGLFSMLDPPEHTWYRRKLSAGFGPRRMRAMTSRIERIVGDRLTAMRRAGGPADLVPTFASPVTSQVIGELLGIRIADETAFRRATEKVLALGGEDRSSEGWAELCAVLADFVHEKRRRPGADLLSALTADDQLSAEEITTMAVMLVTAAQDATTSVFALGSYALLTNPDQLAALRATPSLIDGAVEELLRYLTINQFGSTRVALAGFRVPRRVPPLRRPDDAVALRGQPRPGPVPRSGSARPHPRGERARGVRPRRAPLPRRAAGPHRAAHRLRRAAAGVSRAAACGPGRGGPDARRLAQLQRARPPGRLGLTGYPPSRRTPRSRSFARSVRWSTGALPNARASPDSGMAT